MKEDMVPTLSLSRARAMCNVLFRLLYAHMYMGTREEKRTTKQNNSICVCISVYVCARSLQFKPDGVYVLFFSLILVRANTKRRRLSSMYISRSSHFGSRSTTIKSFLFSLLRFFLYVCMCVCTY